MNEKRLLEKISTSNFPIGLGGCRTHPFSYGCCEYNVTIFDDSKQDSIVIPFEENLVKIQHASLLESRSEVLIQFDEMKIIQDETWDLKMLLSKIKEKKTNLFVDYAKSCLVESLFCVSKAKDGLETENEFVPCWVKSAAYFLADAISLINMTRPSPSHLLNLFRTFTKNQTNEQLLTVTKCISVERATPSLLLRMSKSTIGFSEMIGNASDSEIIKSKYDYLVKNSLLSDCYFYLGYINRNNFISVKNTIHRNPEYIHVLKTAFDIESDVGTINQQIDSLRKMSQHTLTELNK